MLISDFFYPHWTGIAKSALDFALYIKQKYKTRVTVLTVAFDKKLPKQEFYKGIEIIRSNYIFKFSRTYYSIKILFDLLKIGNHYECFVIHSPNSNVLFFTLITKLIYRRRIYIVHHGDLILPSQSGSKIFKWLIEKMFDILTVISFYLADTIITFTADYAKHSRVMKCFTKKSAVFIPPFAMLQGKPSEKLQNSFVSLKYDNLIGFAGRFVEEKGYDILLRSIPLVMNELPKAHFVFAGEINMSYENFFKQNQNLVQEVHKYLTFLGRLTDTELSYFYKQLSVFVISSRSDCFPVTQIEAVKSKVPIVVTDIPGARMLVKESGFGIIVPPENPKALANGIIKAIQERDTLLKNHDKATSFLKKYERLDFIT